MLRSRRLGAGHSLRDLPKGPHLASSAAKRVLLTCWFAVLAFVIAAQAGATWRFWVYQSTINPAFASLDFSVKEPDVIWNGGQGGWKLEPAFLNVERAPTYWLQGIDRRAVDPKLAPSRSPAEFSRAEAKR